MQRPRSASSGISGKDADDADDDDADRDIKLAVQERQEDEQREKDDRTASQQASAVAANDRAARRDLLVAERLARERADLIQEQQTPPPPPNAPPAIPTRSPTRPSSPTLTSSQPLSQGTGDLDLTNDGAAHDAAERCAAIAEETLSQASWPSSPKLGEDMPSDTQPTPIPSEPPRVLRDRGTFKQPPLGVTIPGKRFRPPRQSPVVTTPISPFENDIQMDDDPAAIVPTQLNLLPRRNPARVAGASGSVTPVEGTDGEGSSITVKRSRKSPTNADVDEGK